MHDRFEFSFFAIKPALEKLSRIARKIHGLLAVPNLHRIDAGEDLIVEGPEAEGIAISHLPVKSGVDEINQDLAATVVEPQAARGGFHDEQESVALHVFRPFRVGVQHAQMGCRNCCYP